MIKDWRDLEGLVEFLPDEPRPRVDFVGRERIRDRGGVQAQALYAWTMRAWSRSARLASPSDLNRHEFPFTAITTEEFEVRANWHFSEEDLLLISQAKLHFHSGRFIDPPSCYRRVYLFSEVRLMGIYFDIREGRTLAPDEVCLTGLRADGEFLPEEDRQHMSWEKFQAHVRAQKWDSYWEGVK